MWIIKHKLIIVRFHLRYLYVTLHVFYRVLLNITVWTEGIRESRVLLEVETGVPSDIGSPKVSFC